MARKDKPPRKEPVLLNDVVPSSCKACGSTDRAPYRGTTTHNVAGMTEDGREYNRIVWRYTTCLACSQVRCDRTFELVTEPPDQDSCVERTEPANSIDQPPEIR